MQEIKGSGIFDTKGTEIKSGDFIKIYDTIYYITFYSIDGGLWGMHRQRGEKEVCTSLDGDLKYCSETLGYKYTIIGNRKDGKFLESIGITHY